MPPFHPKSLTSLDRSMVNRRSWNARSHHSDKHRHDDSEVIIVSEKRGGVPYDAPANGKRRHHHIDALEDVLRESKRPKLAERRNGIRAPRYHATARPPQKQHEVFKPKADVRPLMGSRALPFLIDDDSDAENGGSILITPPGTAHSGSTSPMERLASLTQAQKDAARSESKRLREEALAQKQDIKASEKDVSTFNESFSELPAPSPPTAAVTSDSQDPTEKPTKLDDETSGQSTSRRIDEKIQPIPQHPVRSKNSRDSGVPQTIAKKDAEHSQVPISSGCNDLRRERKEADAKRAAEWEARQKHKKAEELLRHEAEQEKRRAARREAVLKMQSAEKETQDAFVAQATALANLEAQRKAAAGKRVTEVSQNQDGKDASHGSAPKSNEAVDTSTKQMQAGANTQHHRASETAITQPRSQRMPAENHSQIRVPPVQKPIRESELPNLHPIKPAANLTNDHRPTDKSAVISAPIQTQSSKDEVSIALATPASPFQENKAREDRIKAMAERNAKLHRAEEEREKEVSPEPPSTVEPLQSVKPRQIVEPPPHVETPSTGPVSLNSRAGQQIMAGLKNESQTSSVQGQQSKGSRNRAHKRSLGEILPEDIKLAQWKFRDNIPMPQIVTLFTNLTGKVRSLETLRKRASQVNQALTAANVSNDLSERVAIGEWEAREELNRLVHGVWPLTEPPRNQPRGALSSPQIINVQSHEKGQDHLSASSPALSPWSKSLPEQAAKVSETQEPSNAKGHPQHAGKTLNLEALQHYLESIQEELVEEHEEAEEARRQTSPAALEDYHHFVYQVQRRCISKEEMDDDILIENVAWSFCGDDCERLKDAHHMALQERLRLEIDFENADDNQWTLTSSTTAEGFVLYTLEGITAGQAQIQVKRGKRTYHDGVMPESKLGWIPRTVYIVMMETIEKSTGDDMFEESKETILRQPLKKAVYTDLEMANRRAIKEFVCMYFESKTGRLDLRQIETQQEESKWLQQLDDDEMFSQSAEDEDGGKKKTVWVEQNEIQGPRNL